MISEDYIFSIKGIQETLDGNLFVQFLEEAVAYLTDKVIIWLINSLIHKTWEAYQTL